MSGLIRVLPPAVAVAALMLHAPLVFAEGGVQVEELSSYQCKDVMRMSGETRTIALAVLHGYALGKKGVVRFVPAELSRQSNDFIEYCLDHPADNAMEAFAKFGK